MTCWASPIPDVPLPAIDPDARRRRLTALVNAASLARQAPAVYVVEDAHWIDEVSESMIADFLTVIPQTPSLVMITYRPEYRGRLTRVADAQTIALAPLRDSETAALIGELLGPDPSVGGLGKTIAERAAGNPFFAEEIVRELAERGVLHGERGGYVSMAGAAEVSVPATVQAAIAARIDRLDPAAKRTLSAAAVIGSKFSRDLLQPLGIDPVLDDLVGGELIDQITLTGEPEYVFHHPLIRMVAYESQLKSDRAQMHRRLAAAIESRDPAAADENAALIAEHLETAGDLRAAYGWHMRAGAWLSTRDVVAAWASWERARQVADALPADDADRTAMRIAAGTLLCRHAFRVHVDISSTRFPELRELCAAAGDKWSLAIGMAGLGQEHMRHGRMREASRLASETMALVESIGDATLTITLSLAAIATEDRDRRGGRHAALVADRHRPGRRRPHQGEHRFRFAAGDGAGHARHRPVGARRCGLARRLRPGDGHGPKRRPDVACLRHHVHLRFRDTGRGAAGRRRCAARHRGGA